MYRYIFICGCGFKYRYSCRDIDTDEDVAVMFPKGKGHAPSLLPPPPKLGRGANLDTSEQQGGRGLGAWASSWTSITIPVLDNLPLGHHRREK